MAGFELDADLRPLFATASINGVIQALFNLTSERHLLLRVEGDRLLRLGQKSAMRANRPFGPLRTMPGFRTMSR